MTKEELIEFLSNNLKIDFTEYFYDTYDESYNTLQNKVIQLKLFLCDKEISQTDIDL